jgi:hypothetical protein
MSAPFSSTKIIRLRLNFSLTAFISLRLFRSLLNNGELRKKRFFYIFILCSAETVAMSIALYHNVKGVSGFV